MKHILWSTTALVLFNPLVYAAPGETKAVTDDGRTVILKKDGTWRELEAAAEKTRGQYDVVKTANKLYQPPLAGTRFYYDPTEWIARVNTNESTNEGIKKSFDGKGGFFGVVIAEKLPVSVDVLKKVALANAQNAATDMEVLEEATHTVNGAKVEYMKYKATVQGMNFVYHGNFYANASGVIQVICGSFDTVDKKNPAKCPDFINGLKTD